MIRRSDHNINIMRGLGPACRYRPHATDSKWLDPWLDPWLDWNTELRTGIEYLLALNEVEGNWNMLSSFGCLSLVVSPQHESHCGFGSATLVRLIPSIDSISARIRFAALWIVTRNNNNLPWRTGQRSFRGRSWRVSSQPFSSLSTASHEVAACTGSTICITFLL